MVSVFLDKDHSTGTTYSRHPNAAMQRGDQRNATWATGWSHSLPYTGFDLVAGGGHGLMDGHKHSQVSRHPDARFSTHWIDAVWDPVANERFAAESDGFAAQSGIPDTRTYNSAAYQAKVFQARKNRLESELPEKDAAELLQTGRVSLKPAAGYLPTGYGDVTTLSLMGLGAYLVYLFGKI